MKPWRRRKDSGNHRLLSRLVSVTAWFLQIRQSNIVILPTSVEFSALTLPGHSSYVLFHGHPFFTYLVLVISRCFRHSKQPDELLCCEIKWTRLSRLRPLPLSIRIILIGKRGRVLIAATRNLWSSEFLRLPRSPLRINRATKSMAKSVGFSVDFPALFNVSVLFGLPLCCKPSSAFSSLVTLAYSGEPQCHCF